MAAEGGGEEEDVVVAVGGVGGTLQVLRMTRRRRLQDNAKTLIKAQAQIIIARRSEGKRWLEVAFRGECGEGKRNENKSRLHKDVSSRETKQNIPTIHSLSPPDLHPCVVGGKKILK